MFDKSLPMTGFEPQISGVGGNRSTNWATPLPQKNYSLSLTVEGRGGCLVLSFYSDDLSSNTSEVIS